MQQQARGLPAENFVMRSSSSDTETITKICELLVCEEIYSTANSFCKNVLNSGTLA
jgi:hypothetical protein